MNFQEVSSKLFMQRREMIYFSTLDSNVFTMLSAKLCSGILNHPQSLVNFFFNTCNVA